MYFRETKSLNLRWFCQGLVRFSGLNTRSRRLSRSDCVTRKMYFDAEHIEERHRHRFEVNPDLVEQFEARGLQFVGHDVDGKRMVLSSYSSGHL